MKKKNRKEKSFRKTYGKYTDRYTTTNKVKIAGSLDDFLAIVPPKSHIKYKSNRRCARNTINFLVKWESFIRYNARLQLWKGTDSIGFKNCFTSLHMPSNWPMTFSARFPILYRHWCFSDIQTFDLTNKYSI